MRGGPSLRCGPVIGWVGPPGTGAPSPITFSSGSWQFSIGGNFKLSMIHDFYANSSPDVFDPRRIPVDGSKGTNTTIQVRGAHQRWTSGTTYGR